MIEYALNDDPRHGLYRSVMSQLQIWFGPVAFKTGAGRGAAFLERRGVTGRLL